MNPPPDSPRKPADQLRRDWYVIKVDLLAQDVPSGHRKAIRRELKSGLTAAAAEVGMSQAVRDLGPASALAHQFRAAEGRKLPHWWTGAITFIVLVYGWAGMWLATMSALIEASTQLVGDKTVTMHAVWLGTTVTVTHGGGVLLPVHLSGQVTPSGFTIAVLFVVPLVTARSWRYRPAWLQRRRVARAASLPASPGDR